MKKLFVLVVMTVAMIFFASCGNNAKKTAEATEETKSECCSDSTKTCTGECEKDSAKCAGCEKHEEAK